VQCTEIHDDENNNTMFQPWVDISQSGMPHIHRYTKANALGPVFGKSHQYIGSMELLSIVCCQHSQQMTLTTLHFGHKLTLQRFVPQRSHPSGS
jgi:hypothetical protein